MAAECPQASDMNIKIKREGPRALDREIQRKLKSWNEDHPGPDVAIVWNPLAVKLGQGCYDPRWEIWVEVTSNSHPNHRFVEKQGDIRFDGCTWRFLNTYKQPDGSFAPLDDRLFRALYWSDTWRHREHYEEALVSQDIRKKKAETDMIRDTAYGLTEKWKNFDRTQVGSGSSGNWRAKEIWR